MQVLVDIFSMPLFPHLYMIPMTFVLGILFGFYLKNQSDQEDEILPPKPKIDKD